ncbi:MAG: hypothetical protein MK101_11690 [Phycisphaerales bacterium]|nr:hypothetical protein [Phycisphaerales bacterium]
MSGEIRYSHTQKATLIRLALAVMIVGLAVGAVLVTQALWIPVGVLLLCLLLFHSLRVEIDARHVHIAFGIGLIRRSIALSDIASCEIVTTPWYMGYGIRYVFKGWMWNVSGKWSVELTYTSGGHFRIGTDEPEALKAALDDAGGR